MIGTTLGLILVAAWVILAASRFVQGGVVERPERVPQLYGYTVCLIALIWALASLMSMIGDALSFSAPELRSNSDFVFEPSVTSFEAFRTTYDRARQFSSPNPNDAKLDPVPEPELRRRYDAIRADRILRARFETTRELIIGILSLLIATGVFAFHWRWLKRFSPPGG